MTRRKIDLIRPSYIVFVIVLLVQNISADKISYAQANNTKSVLSDSLDYAQNRVERMTEAHGGWRKWISKSVMSFTNEQYHFTSPTPRTRNFEFADLYYYRVAIKPESSIGYASLSDGRARIVFDGTDIWTVGLTDENNNLDKSPAILLFSTYSLINLPWLSQMDSVQLKYVGTGKLPLEVGRYEIIKITYGSRSGNKHAGYYELYIDSDTNILKAVRQGTVLPQLPGTDFHLGVSSLPTPILRIFKSYDSVDGLYIPSSYVSYIDGMLLGISFVRGITLDRELDKTLISPPNKAGDAKGGAFQSQNKTVTLFSDSVAEKNK